MTQQLKEAYTPTLKPTRRARRLTLDQVYIVRGKGSHCWDVKGNEYVDYISARGANILGYAHPAVADAVNKQMADGVLVSLAYLHCIKLYEKLMRHVPCAEMIELRKTGSEATAAAVRLARAYTRRDKIIRCGYHGWLDWCANGIGSVHPSLRPANDWRPTVRGVPQAVTELTLAIYHPNDLDYVEQLLKANEGQVACLIIDTSEVLPPIAETLQGLRELTQRYGVVLIFDEVKTSLRVALGGVQERFGVVPDLATMSKALGNGFPITAVVGKKAIMKMSAESPLWSTYSTEAVSVGAAIATIEVLRQTDGSEHLWRLGQRLIDGVNAVIADLGLEAEVEAQAWNVAPMPYIWFKGMDVSSQVRRDRFYQELTGCGVLMLPDHMNFINLSHSPEDIDRTIEACATALARAKEG